MRALTRIPRWTLDPVPGTGEHELAIPASLVARLWSLAAELEVPLGSVLAAAHARVLATLSGEPEVTTGYVPFADGPPLPILISTEPRSWRELVSEAHERRRMVSAEARFETVLDATGSDGGELPDGVVARVAAPQRDGRIVLRVVYRTEHLDRGAAGRIARYHLAALARMATDPDAEHSRQSLLSATELRHQVDGLAGPRRELPDRRLHELIEERVAANPHAVAAVHGGREWTYGELNARANRLARALLARRLRAEDVVAVVTERNLDWMAAVLAIFKAGGAYLPIEPQFPADRIATMLDRAGCRLVLTEQGSDAALNRALTSLPGSEALAIDAACAEGHAEGDLGIAVSADQLAYIYFTSGSTGTPKGAMCEHAGMLNHLLAKVEDLGIGEGQVVAQTAPQCFDISLWQLVSALLVGGRTLIVEQEAILDVERFVDTIAAGGVAAVQVVPSYLDVVLSYLEQNPRELPDLRCVSVTGEAVSVDLARRWFAVAPHIKLVNAYGLTETSDDTNHEVMTRAPSSERVPLGRPVRNVRVYVVDEHLCPVPLGAPGEIVFSGVCVGRGYVNDPERTSLSFGPDPHREGERLYRSGDLGRWRPDGKLEFLGRRDAQVKVNGFRIEIGEVEGALAAEPGVGGAAVVVAERADRSKRLVAFYSGPSRLEGDALQRRLSASLPRYMLPSSFHRLESLPCPTTARSTARRSARSPESSTTRAASATRRTPPPSGGWLESGRSSSASP